MKYNQARGKIRSSALPGLSRMKNLYILPIFLLFLFLVFSFVSCTCTDSDDDDSADDDDSSGDDDSTDDDTGDDDSTPDDDDDNDDDNDTVDTGFYWKPGVYVQYITGGFPGENGTSTAIGPDGTWYVTADKGHGILLYSKAPGKDSWKKEVVGNLGEQPSLAVDEEGNVHIAYYYTPIWPEGILKYATNQSGEWVNEIVDDQGDVGEHPSLALDSLGFVHIGYFDYTNKDPKYATNRSGQWVKEVVVSEDDLGMNTALALDKDDFAHMAFISYNPLGSGELIYATNKTGQWEYEPLSLPVATCDIAVDDQGFAHISHNLPKGLFGERSSQNYTTNKSGIWDTQLVDNLGDSGWNSSIAVDQSGAAYITYDRDGSLGFATNKSGIWQKVDIISEGGNGKQTSIVLDANGIPHISSHNRIFEELIASKYDGKGWSIDIIDEGGTVSPSTNIAFTYHNSIVAGIKEGSLSTDTLPTLYLAERNLQGNWQVTVVDNRALTESFGSQSSLAVDSDDNIHVSYYAEPNLGYATNKSGNWYWEEIDTDIYSRSTLAIDRNDSVHIVYRKEKTYHITNRTGDWLTELVDDDFYADSFVLDSAGYVHLGGSLESEDDGAWYYTNESGAWVGQQVEYTDVTGHISVDVDSKGFVHLCYEEDDIGIKYATNLSGVWDAELVGIGKRHCEIENDENDSAHMLWEDLNYGSTYASHIGDTWKVVENIVPGTARPITLDNDGMVHTLFHSNSGLWYARFPQGYTDP